MLCKTQGVDYEYKVVGADLTKEQLFELCGGPVKSVPQIFIQKDELFERIGGFTELKESFSNIHKGSLLNG
jgi:glutaredoxin